MNTNTHLPTTITTPHLRLHAPSSAWSNLILKSLKNNRQHTTLSFFSSINTIEKECEQYENRTSA